jgi:2-dehydro-3-deoxygalactonokinase
MSFFLSCDWGTSSFRLRLINTEDLAVTAEEKANTGIAHTFARWQESNNPDSEERIGFYRRIIQEHICHLEQRVGHSLAQVPVIISGMASSSIGMQALPYQNLPFPVNGAGLQTKHFPANTTFPHDILLVSGIKSTVDVMRGEETQLIGCINEADSGNCNGLYLFPGTHSKHIQVKDGQVIGFKTYMTGEFFDLLAHKSILNASVASAENSAMFTGATFRQGVRDAREINILHLSFRVRTNELFEKISKSENYTYLSGLVIGSELKDLLTSDYPKIYLVGGATLKRNYEIALQELGLSERVHTFPAAWVDEAVVRGQFKIFKRLKTYA